MCDKCKKDNCGCKEIEFCGCKTKLDLLCSTYTGDTLEKLGIKKGTDGNTVIKIINDYLEKADEPNPVIIENVGTGIGLFKEFSEIYTQDFKTIVAGQGINITEQTNTVTISIDPTYIQTLVQSIITPAQ